MNHKEFLYALAWMLMLIIGFMLIGFWLAEPILNILFKINLIFT